MSPLILCCEVWFVLPPVHVFWWKLLHFLSNLKATIMLCFKIWIFLFVLKLFNILHSFLVTLVYWLQYKGKPLGLCSAQAIEVFKHQLVLVDSGISCLRRQRILLSTTTLRQLGDNFDTTWRQLWNNLKTSWRQLKYNFVTTLTQRWHNYDTTMTQLWQNFALI